MKKKGRLTAVILCIVLVFASMLCGCGTTDDKTSERQKYDVTMKLVNNLGDEWIFTPDIEKMSVTFDYTGEEMGVWLDTYNLPDHPRWKNNWITPDSGGDNCFLKSISFGDGDKWIKSVKSICDRGVYDVCVEACASSTLWNFREIHLYICVK